MVARDRAQRAARGLRELGAAHAHLPRGRAHQRAQRRRARLQPDRRLPPAHAGGPGVAGSVGAEPQPARHGDGARAGDRRSGLGEPDLRAQAVRAVADRRQSRRRRSAPRRDQRRASRARQRQRECRRYERAGARVSRAAPVEGGPGADAAAGRQRGRLRRGDARLRGQPDHARDRIRAADRNAAAGCAAADPDRPVAGVAQRRRRRRVVGHRDAVDAQPRVPLSSGRARRRRLGALVRGRAREPAAGAGALVHPRLRRRPARAGEPAQRLRARRLAERRRSTTSRSTASRS